MKTILYLHGFASFFKPNSDKALALSQLGQVVGLDLDYSKGAEMVLHDALTYAQQQQVDLIVGCSLGGWLAAHVGSQLNLPFVCLNPSLYPSQTLARYSGDGVAFDGKPFHLSLDTIASYPDIALDGKGLVLLQRDDDILDAEQSFKALKAHYETYLFEGGSHRFDGLENHLVQITEFILTQK